MLRCRKIGAFTLVELLVVIAVIALLMGILLPTLQRARGLAHRIICMSNLRNFSMAHKQYQAETEKYLPHTNYDPYYTPWYNNDIFRAVLGLPTATAEEKTRRPFGTIQEWPANVPRKFICPAATYALSHGENGLYAIDRSYGVNIDGDYYAKKQGANLSDKESWVKQPSTKLFMADALDWWISYFFCHLYLEYGENWVGRKTYGMTAFRHNDGLNVMYWDGHCGRLRTEEVMDNPALWDPLR